MDLLINEYKKGDIKAAQNFKNQLDEALGNWATSGSYEVLCVNPKAAVGAMVYAIGELTIPVNAYEIISVDKLGRAVKVIETILQP
ncbi:hypothetical protein [Acinetobacter sp. TUM15071]|uniref:hypothetical protein n=1 Tax=Acinetobacter sp. TUM15071 TaxID=2609135 RepID=UPI00124DA480|nr:hypothetical protein [Acinetobacter sp. TUM15071]